MPAGREATPLKGPNTMFAKDNEANVTSSAPETARQSAGAEGGPERGGRGEDPSMITKANEIVKEYATKHQIEFFDRLRSGDDPEHEEARTELVTLVDDTLELLYSLRVDRADHDAEVRRILTKLDVIAGNEVDVFTLDVSTAGYDVSDPELMNDLKDEVKARFDEDEKLVLALLAEPGVNLDEVDNNLGCVGHHRYSFSTFDPVTAEKFGFMGEAEREAEAEAARVAAEKRQAECEAKNAAARQANEALIDEKGLQGAFAASYQAVVAAKGEAVARAIRSAVEQVAKGDPWKQIELFHKAVAV